MISFLKTPHPLQSFHYVLSFLILNLSFELFENYTRLLGKRNFSNFFFFLHFINVSIFVTNDILIGVPN